MSTGVVWVDVVVAMLLVLSGVLVLVSAIGFVRLQNFFLRMHPPALAYTLSTWCVAGASALSLSVLGGRLVLHPLLLPALLALTVPVTTLLLARVSLFRDRRAGIEGTPPASVPRQADVAGPESSP
ncbi:monovalent cation/H(+) antiporter subunit G [Aerolutibacter ruishenii]|uniref:Multisubunit potassium/proton antiporter PhaG subunit n=1 Tax=Aerolutibacter ruishenii TaxID=686800 RepID=A0A562LKQ1_9GAMM|nr:monovalent cation/H(+) antiporter subunit G [Lysobacter ruishenii]TWI08210.1 multisubunit potassium/proton antiporter PhaG subunit [Lysobacter ruishenii]